MIGKFFYSCLWVFLVLIVASTLLTMGLPVFSRLFHDARDFGQLPTLFWVGHHWSAVIGILLLITCQLGLTGKLPGSRCNC